MIFDTLKNIKNYMGLSENLDKAIASIVKGEYLNAPTGRTDIDGDEVYFNIQDNVILKNPTDTSFEIHKKYVDIQLIINGEECFGYGAKETLNFKNDYDDAKDFQLLDGEIETLFTMKGDRFILFFPEEPHMPCLKSKISQVVKKAVYKIKM